MARLFGTDGVRGVANRELTPELAYQLGRAGATVLAGHLTHKPRILIGTDTRISCGMLEAALASGICAAGADAVSCGVLPTPGVAYLTAVHPYDAGVVISASHNSFEFNGIKFFSARGFKLPDAVEDEIERLISSGAYPERPEAGGVGRCLRYDSAAKDYLEHLKESIPLDLSGVRIALDCANGAAGQIGPALFRDLGADVIAIGDQPDGVNINDQCGSTHLETLSALVTAHHCDIGLAFDGDADRMLAVDSDGEVVDGDVVMAILADDMHRAGTLASDTLVITVMSNMGLDLAAEKLGISLVKTKVGDRYVLETMQENGYRLGGEQSGHIILLDHATTGDGLLSGLRLLMALQHRGQTLREAKGIMTVLPQVLRSAKVPNGRKDEAMADAELQRRCGCVEEELAGRGRVLVRASGTEPIVRVMLEGEDVGTITRMAEELVSYIEEHFS